MKLEHRRRTLLLGLSGENTCSEGSNSLTTSHPKRIRIKSSRSDVRAPPYNQRAYHRGTEKSIRNFGLLGAILELPGISERASRATRMPGDSDFIGVGIVRNFNVHLFLFQVVEDVWGPLVVAKEPVSKVPNIGEGIPDLAGGKTSVVA